MSGHGHVVPNANGMKARCGGPRICRDCALEFTNKYGTQPDPPRDHPLIKDIPGLCREPDCGSHYMDFRTKRPYPCPHSEEA